MFVVPPSGGFRPQPPEGGTTNIKFLISRSSQNLLHDIAMHIRKAIVPPTEAIRQSRVVKPHQVQDRGVQVVNVDLLLDRVPTELVRGTISHATLDAAPC